MTTPNPRGRPRKVFRANEPGGVNAPKDYKLTLKIGDKTYSSVGETMLEALHGLKKPEKLMMKSTLTISTPKDSRELLLQPVRAKRLFYNSRGVSEVIAKQLETGLMK